MFTDVRLPGSIDGLALAALVAKTRQGLKIVITSGSENCESRATEMADAFFPKPYALDRVSITLSTEMADAFFPKPYALDRVIDCIENLLAGDVV